MSTDLGIAYLQQQINHMNSSLSTLQADLRSVQERQRVEVRANERCSANQAWVQRNEGGSNLQMHAGEVFISEEMIHHAGVLTS